MLCMQIIHSTLHIDASYWRGGGVPQQTVKFEFHDFWSDSPNFSQQFMSNQNCQLTKANNPLVLHISASHISTSRSRNAWETCAIKWNHVISVLITWSPRRGDVGKHKIVGDFLKNRRAETWNSPLGEFIRVHLWGTSFLKTQWTKVFQTKN